MTRKWDTFGSFHREAKHMYKRCPICNWRKQSEEPAPKNVLIEVYDPCSRILDSVRPGVSDNDCVYQSEYWRPLDVPKAEGTK